MTANTDDVIPKTRSGFAIWKLAILKASLLAGVAGVTTLTTALAGLEWTSMSITARLLIVFGAFVSVANSIVGFLDKTMQQTEEKQKAENKKDQ